MAIKEYKIEIEGLNPVIWNRMKRELELEKKKLKKDQLDEWEEKNWLRKAEYDTKGNVILPNEWIKGTLIDACKKTRIVPHYAKSKSQTYTNYVQGMMIELKKPMSKKKDLEYYGAYVGSRGGMGGGKIWKVRPLLKKWKATFTIKDPIGRMKKDELYALLNYAGLMIGVGDNRRNNYGRFVIKSIKEMN